MSDSNKTLKIVGIGCLVLALVSCCIAGSCAGLIYQSTSAPAEAAHAFLSEVRTNNDAPALARMNATYQATHDLATFSMGVNSLPGLRGSSDATLSSRNVQNNVADMSGSLTTPTGEVPVRVTLTETGGNWYIDTVTVSGVPLP